MFWAYYTVVVRGLNIACTPKNVSGKTSSGNGARLWFDIASCVINIHVYFQDVFNIFIKCRSVYFSCNWSFKSVSLFWMSVTYINFDIIEIYNNVSDFFKSISGIYQACDWHFLGNLETILAVTDIWKISLTIIFLLLLIECTDTEIAIICRLNIYRRSLISQHIQ